MKRVYKSKEEPELLRQYRLHNPEETWEHFRRRCRRGYKPVSYTHLTLPTKLEV